MDFFQEQDNNLVRRDLHVQSNSDDLAARYIVLDNDGDLVFNAYSNNEGEAK